MGELCGLIMVEELLSGEMVSGELFDPIENGLCVGWNTM